MLGTHVDDHPLGGLARLGYEVGGGLWKPKYRLGLAEYGNHR